jgi:ferric-dicitrate binding protein FerR (iron transport regulator)
MNSKPGTLKFLTFCITMMVGAASGTALPATAARRAQEQPSGKLAVTGKVSVDGKSAASGDIFNSSSTATTAKGSSAVVSLGKLGRVEVLPSSIMKLSFGASSITGWLYAGRASVTKEKGVSANVSTRHGEVIADGAEAAGFTLNMECGNTVVSVVSGQVELHANGKITKVAAGSRGSLGTPRAGCSETTTP